MTRQDICNLPKHAGIYLIRDKTNGKCHVGKATKLRMELLRTWDDKPFGNWENLEITVLDTFHDALSQRTRCQLDSLERKYIEKYEANDR